MCKYLWLQIRMQCAFFFLLLFLSAKSLATVMSVVEIAIFQNIFCYCSSTINRMPDLWRRLLSQLIVASPSRALECLTSNRSDVQYFSTILLCFVINSLFQHLHMSAPTAQIKPTINVMQDRERTRSLNETNVSQSVIFVSDKIRIFYFFKMKISAVRKALEKRWHGEKKYKRTCTCAYRQLGKNNIYTVWLNFIQRQRQMCVFIFIIFFLTYKSTLNT